MQGKKNYSKKLFISFQLSDRVPKENFYRRLSETLDLHFLYNDTRELYGKTGNPSIDPVVFRPAARHTTCFLRKSNPDPNPIPFWRAFFIAIRTILLSRFSFFWPAVENWTVCRRYAYSLAFNIRPMSFSRSARSSPPALANKTIS